VEQQGLPAPTAVELHGFMQRERTERAQTAGLTHPRAILAIILVSYFMILLDNSVIFTGLPHIRAEMGLSTTGLAWVQDAYTLVFGGFLLLGARAGDLLGRRRVFIVGLAVFSAASLLIVVAPAGWWLISARALQGIGGAITATLGMGALVFGVISSADVGWGSPETITSLAAGVALLALFVLTEWRAKKPIMPLQLFISRERSGAYLARILYLGAMIGFFYFTTQFLQVVLGYNPLQAGLAFLPMTAVNFAVALQIPRLRSRFSNAALLTIGVAVTLAGMIWLSRLGVDSSYLESVALPMVLLGIGQGLAFAPLTSAGIAGVTAKDAGAASGLVNTAHQLGSALGIAVLVTVSAGAAAGTTTAGNAAAALAAQFGSALTAGSVLLTLCLITALAVIVPAEIAARRATVPHRPANHDPQHPELQPVTVTLRKDLP